MKPQKPEAPKANTTASEAKVEFLFGKTNYLLLLLGIAVIVIGFLLMIGGGSENPKVFNEAIFNFRRIRLAPTVVLAGFGITVFAILKNPKNS
jgi:membrane-bound ClpP family serine protease